MKLMSLTSAKSSPAVQAALDRLTCLTQTFPDLCDAAVFLRATIPLLHQAGLSIEPLRIDAQHVQDKLAFGISVLTHEELPFDLGAARQLFLKLCKAVELQHGSFEQWPAWSMNRFVRGNPSIRPSEECTKHADDAARRGIAARHLRHAVETGMLDLSDAFMLTSSSSSLAWVMTTRQGQLDTGLLQVLTQNCLKPFLRSWVGSIHADTSSWSRGQCPMCGATPTLSEIVGKTAARRLRCGMCGCGWDYPRLCCAFCGNQDHKLLTRISVEGDDDRHFVQACNVCKGFLKVLVHFEPLAVEQLAVEDLATIHLDLAACQLQYVRTEVK